MCLKFLYNDFISSYEKLLKTSAKSTIHVRNYRALCIEPFKILNDLNPSL